jgi:hypothetical protein
MHINECNKLREKLLGNWASICCTTYIVERQKLERPLITMSFLVKFIKKMVEDVLVASTLNEERKILQEILDMLANFNEQNKYSVELRLNNFFLQYIHLLGETEIKESFDQYAKGLWEKTVNGIKLGTEMLIKNNPSEVRK